MMEVGLAHIANDQKDEAEKCFKKALQNQDPKIKRLAKQMLFQEEAQDFIQVLSSNALSQSSICSSQLDTESSGFFEARIKAIPKKNMKIHKHRKDLSPIAGRERVFLKNRERCFEAIWLATEKNKFDDGPAGAEFAKIASKGLSRSNMVAPEKRYPTGTYEALVWVVGMTR